MKKVLWQELRRNEFEQAVKADAIAIIPVGSTEQHGDHLPVNTDANSCFTIAKRAAQAIDEFPVLVLPVIWTGYSPMFVAYPGTITLKYHTFVEVLTEIAVSVYTHGFRKILFLNGHGGNHAIVAGIGRKLIAEERVPSVGYTWWFIPPVEEQMEIISESDKGFRSVGHAGELETSLQLYLQPELVEASAAFWVQGVWGDPSAGTSDKGERLINAAVDALVKLLREYHSGELEASMVSGKEVFVGRKTK